MNSTIYIFGKEGKHRQNFYQYPDDHTADIFTGLEPRWQGDSMLAIRRDASMAYHLYYRRATNGYIGVGVLLNGYWISSPNRLLPFLQIAVEFMTAGGSLASQQRDGSIVSNLSQLLSHETTTNEIIERLRRGVDTLSSYCRDLPPVDVSVQADTMSHLTDDATDGDWQRAMLRYRSIYAFCAPFKLHDDTFFDDNAPAQPVTTPAPIMVPDDEADYNYEDDDALF